MKMILNQTSSFILSLQTPVILSKVYPELDEGLSVTIEKMKEV